MMQNKNDLDELKRQVQEIMEEDQLSRSQEERRPSSPRRRKKKKNRALKILTIILLMILVPLLLLVGTKGGRRLLYSVAGNFIYSNMDTLDVIKPIDSKNQTDQKDKTRLDEDYVTNYLIFGIEEFGGAKNTDSMMIATINTKDRSVKLTSLLRDSYVEIPGYKANKLNSAYSRGGVDKLIETIELNYKINIDGYASVNFENFEKIVDSLGGVTIELGKEEAAYLNKTNYISNKKYRNVKAGVNKLNGNQVLGYCRVRKVKTLTGENNDYGRIVRQQRVLKAIFESFMDKNIIQQLDIVKTCLGYVSTDLSKTQIQQAIEDVVENRITKLETFRVPVDGSFDAPKKYNGIGYPIVLEWEKNRVELFKFIFSYSEEEAKKALAALE